MSTRRTDGERTRERILDKALPLFAANGYDGTSIRMIANAAKVNVATLAYHFEGKEGLYHTVIMRLHEEMMDRWPEPQPGAEQDVLTVLVSQGWAFAKSHEMHVRLQLRHVLDQGKHPDTVVDTFTMKELDRADQLIALFRPEWSSSERRLLVFSMVHLIVRFLIEDEDQLRALVQAEGDVDAAVVGFLVRMLRRQLGLPEAVTA